jgi:hypothetical protein
MKRLHLRAAIAATLVVSFASIARCEFALSDETAAQNITTEESAVAEAPAAQGWKLPQPTLLQKHGIAIGGWLEQGITYNSLDPADRFNGPNLTNDRSGEYQLNQAWLYAVRPTNTNGYGWDLGGRIDMSYGTDWRFGQCYGLENRIDDSNSFYGLVMPQFYGEVAYNDLTVKMGHFATFTSLEVVPAPMNFFYSHTLLMGGYFDPVLVTGVQADYKLNDNWTLSGGFNRGWCEFEDPSETLNFLGGFKWASDSKKSNLSIMLDAGPQTGFATYDGSNVHDRTSVITVYTTQLTKRLNWGQQYTAGVESHGSIARPGRDASWYGTEQLFTYTLTEKWSFGLRYEWVRDNDGARVAGIGNVLLTDRGWDGLPGFAGAFNDLSLGLNWRPNKNIVLRPEVRWDWYDGPTNIGGELPYGNGTSREQFTTACDLIVTF